MYLLPHAAWDRRFRSDALWDSCDNSQEIDWRCHIASENNGCMFSKREREKAQLWSWIFDRQWFTVMIMKSRKNICRHISKCRVNQYLCSSRVSNWLPSMLNRTISLIKISYEKELYRSLTLFLNRSKQSFFHCLGRSGGLKPENSFFSIQYRSTLSASIDPQLFVGWQKSRAYCSSRSINRRAVTNFSGALIAQSYQRETRNAINCRSCPTSRS